MSPADEKLEQDAGTTSKIQAGDATPASVCRGDHCLAASAHTKGAQKAVALSILERDGRDTRLPLKPLGGVSACAIGDLQSARNLAAAGWPAAHAADKHGSTSLMWAAGGGHLPVVRWLLEEVGAEVDATNKDRRTALQWACKTGQYTVVSFLLDVAGADPTLRMKDDSTAFDWAVRPRHMTPDAQKGSRAPHTQASHPLPGTRTRCTQVLSGHMPTMELLANHPRVDIFALNKFGCAPSDANIPGHMWGLCVRTRAHVCLRNGS